MAMSLVQFQVRGGSRTEVEKQIGGNRVNIHGAFTEAESGTNMFDRYSIRKELIPYLLYIHKNLAQTSLATQEPLAAYMRHK
jgi:hypothetical protein